MEFETRQKGGFDFADKGKPLKRLLEQLYNISEDYRLDFEQDWIDVANLYYGFVDLAGRDPNLLHAHMPEAFALIETVTPDDIKALLGIKPYFPIEPNEPSMRGAAQALEKLTDTFCDMDETAFFEKMAVGAKMRRLFGGFALMPYWRVRVRERYERREEMVRSYKLGVDTKRVKYVDEGLDYKLIPYWNIGVDPVHGRIPNMRWKYIKMPMSKEELKSMMSVGKFDIKYEELSKDDNHDFDSLLIRMENDMGYGFNRQDAGVGQLTVWWLEPTQRYVMAWGHRDSGFHILRDRDNPLGFTPLIDFPNTLNPIPERFYAQGEIRPNAQLFHMLNDAYSQLFNSQSMNMDPPVMYPEGWVDPATMRFSPGSKTPYNPAYADRMQSAVWSWPISQLDKNAYEVPDRIRDAIDRSSGVAAPDRGEFPQRKELAYTVKKVSEGSDARTAMNLRISERSMERLAKQSWRIIDLCIPTKMAQSMLGDDYKYYQLFRHPDDIPMGYEMRFKSSAMLTDRDGKTQKLLSYYQLAQPGEVNRAALIKAAIELDLSEVLSAEQLDAIFAVQPQGEQQAGDAQLAQAGGAPAAPPQPQPQQGQVAA